MAMALIPDLVDAARLEEAKPALLLLDIMMPKVDGLQLLERLKQDERWRDLPVLMVSSMPPEEATVRALGLGAADFISKPFRVRELLARVQSQLRTGKELQRAREEARSSSAMIEILRGVPDSLKPAEINSTLLRRPARVLSTSKCSRVLGRAGDPSGVVGAAYGNPRLRNLQVDLARYPEIRHALAIGRSVLVRDVMTDPHYAEVRDHWSRDRIQVTTRSAAAVPFSMRETLDSCHPVACANARPLAKPASLRNPRSRAPSARRAVSAWLFTDGSGLVLAVRDRQVPEPIAGPGRLPSR